MTPAREGTDRDASVPSRPFGSLAIRPFFNWLKCFRPRHPSRNMASCALFYSFRVQWILAGSQVKRSMACSRWQSLRRTYHWARSE